MSSASAKTEGHAQPRGFAARHRARRLAVQALYECRLNPATAEGLIAHYRAEYDFERVDGEHFAGALRGVLRDPERYDALIEPLLDRPLDDLDPVEHAILHLVAWELAERVDVPYRVVIDQAITLARLFGASESHRYVNGVADRLARRLRRAETTPGR